MSWSRQGLEKCLKEKSGTGTSGTEDWYWEYRNTMEYNGM